MGHLHSINMRLYKCIVKNNQQISKVSCQRSQGMQSISLREAMFVLKLGIEMHRQMSRLMRLKNERPHEKNKICIGADQLRIYCIFFFSKFWIVQSLFFLNPKFPASSHLLYLYSSVCVRPGRKPQRLVFS